MTKYEQAKKLYQKNVSIKDIATRLNTHINYIYRIVREMNQDSTFVESDTDSTDDDFQIDNSIDTSNWTIPTIGADPEFLIYNDGELIPAHSIFSRGLKSRVGCDGCSSTGEIRPKQELDAFKLSRNIKNCLNSAKKYLLKSERFKDAKMVCGSGIKNVPIGGHIHFGINYDDSQNLRKGFALASILTINLGNNNNLSKARKLRNYGHLLDLRSQPWGMEYRTNISWLKDPEFTTKILILNHLIAIEYLNSQDTYNTFKGLFHPSYETKFNSQTFKKMELKIIQKNIIKSIKTFKSYKANIHNYSRILNPFFDECIKAKSIDNPDFVDEQKWRLSTTLPLPRPKKIRFAEFSQDDYLSDIMTNFENPLIENTSNMNIRIIGINVNRGSQIYISRILDSSELRAFCNDNSWTICSTDDFNSFECSKVIGFRRDLRQNQQDKILELLNLIKSKLLTISNQGGQ